MSRSSPSLPYTTTPTSWTDSGRRAQFGLKVLSEGRVPVTVDIVAVHGLGGHLFRTWTHKTQCCWLRDLLPMDIPDARVMTFGYDANVIGSSMNTLKDSAQLLLQHLLIQRNPDLIPSSRPILFICHSLGGLVTKQALVKASLSPQYKTIRASTIGTIFMGTPHRGSSVASLGKIFANIARLFPLSISVSHLNSLHPDSRDLSELSTAFLKNIQSPPVEVVNFFESRTTKIGLMRIPIVPQASAVLEPIGCIREGISLDGDHREICQFSSGDDSQYQLVLRNIRSIMVPDPGGSSLQDHKSNTVQGNMKSILSLLQGRSVPRLEPNEGTCGWVFDYVPIKKLRGVNGHKMLWIHGPPGIGKSFISSYIASNLRAETDTIVIYSTFNPQTPDSRTEATLASVILHQLLAEPKLKDAVLSSLTGLYQSRHDTVQISFRQVLHILVKVCQYSRQFYLVLDGLDEMVESTSTKTGLLRTLVDFQQEDYAHILKIIVLSRDVTPFREMLSFDLSFRIKPEHTEGDVMTFVGAHLSRMALPNSMIDLANVTARQKSHGLFIWASLFISGLQIESNEKGSLQPYIVEAEEGLSSLYAHAMMQLHRSSPELLELRKMALTFCATADVPLNIPELDEAIKFGLGYGMDNAEMVRKACGPFVEVTDGRVSLSHLSVRDYVLTTDKGRCTMFLPDSRVAAHTTMATICLGYLSLDDHQQSFSGVPWYVYQDNEQFPLLKYASLNWERHIREAGSLDPSSLEILRKFVTSNAGIRWATCYYPNFQCQMGESQPSAFVELRSVLLRIKGCVLRGGSNDTHPSSLKAEICQNLDTFLIQAFQTVLAVERNFAGIKSRSTIERLLGLSRILQACSSPKQAQLTAREASSIATACFGAMDPLTLICKHHGFLLELSNMSTEMQGVSKTNTLQGLRDLSYSMNKVLGQYHQDTLRCYHDMGMALFLDRQFNESYHVLKKVYGDMKKHIGPSRLTQRTANNLAHASYQLGRFSEAESVLLSVEDVQQLSVDTVSVELDSYHIFSFEGLELLANVYLQNIQPSRAVLLHKRAIIGRALLVGYDAELLVWVRNLGATLIYEGKFSEATSHYVIWIYNYRKNIQLDGNVAILRESLVECLENWKVASKRGLCEAPVFDEKIAAALNSSLDNDLVSLFSGSLSPLPSTFNEVFYIVSFCFSVVLALYICTHWLNF